MNISEQKDFIKNLLNGVNLRINQAIDAKKIPESWDGHELRILVSDIAKECASISAIVKNPRTARARDYKNHVFITNI